jgi:5-methylcytosine-specific restriction protein A
VPDAPARLCPRGHVYNGRGRCPQCRALYLQTHPEATGTGRGYDWAWNKLRERHIAQNPLCARCAARGRVTAAREVDHIHPFDGPGDPRRLDPSNLQSLCVACHVAKTRADRARPRDR